MKGRAVDMEHGKDMSDFCERWLARAATADGMVFDFGGVISVSPLKN